MRRHNRSLSARSTSAVARASFAVNLRLMIRTSPFSSRSAEVLSLKASPRRLTRTTAYLSGHRTRVTKTLVYGISGVGAAPRWDHSIFPGPYSASDIRAIRHGARRHRSCRFGPDNHHGGQRVALLGVFFLGVVNNGMNILNVPIDINLICKGVIIVIALALAARARQSSSKM